MPDLQFKPPQMPVFGRWRVNIPETKIKTDRERAFSLGEIHYKLLEKFAPPSILVNHYFEVQYMSDTAGRLVFPTLDSQFYLDLCLHFHFTGVLHSFKTHFKSPDK